MPAPGATSSAKQVQQIKTECENQTNQQRKQQRLDDIKSALTFSLVGIALFAIHFPQARKQSK